jgi:hypothetical protein
VRRGCGGYKAKQNREGEIVVVLKPPYNLMSLVKLLLKNVNGGREVSTGYKQRHVLV